MKSAHLLICFLFITTFSFAQKPAGLNVQDKAPDFFAKDQEGKEISLKRIRRKGPVVLLFYRGNWCRYCNKQLSELQDSLRYIKARGANVIAITPEAQEGINKTVKKTKVSFPIVFDKNVTISKAYAVSFQLDTATVNKYKSGFGLDLLKINEQTGDAYLPVPAVYIIDKRNYNISFFDTNYTNRPSVKDLLENL